MKKYAILQRLSVENLYNTFLGLPPRQQTIALAGVVAGILFLTVLPLSLAAGKLGGLQSRIADTKTQMGEIARQVEEYNKARARLTSLEALLRGGFEASIASAVEGLATQAQMKENIDSLKERPVAPSDLYDEASVEVKVSRVTLQQLVDFLHKIENAPNKTLRIKRIDIRLRFDNKHLLDATFDVVSYKLTQEA